MSPTHGAQAIDVPQREGIKETLESIIVALLLAFVFRAFVVDAFVVPVGSMPPAFTRSSYASVSAL